MAKQQKESVETTVASTAKITHPVVRTVFGIVAILCILVFSNWLVRATPLGNKTIDLTEDKRHTLTPGTKAILSELETPVIIRFYATRKSEAMPRRMKNYMRKVDDLLNRYKLLAKDKIRIEHLDPQPDTDAEDSASMDGISGQRIEDENLYFGLAISSLDQQTTIPYLDPVNDTMLEYSLSSAIANVTTFKKPKIGLMTTLPLAGTPATKPDQEPGPPWVIFQLLRQRYSIKHLGMTPDDLNPETTPVLLLVHPAGISPHTEYLIDQYLLKGGVVVACLDPYALTAPQADPRTSGVLGGGVSRSSTLPHLLESWGVGFDAFSVIADGKYATDFGDGKRMHTHLSLSADAITSKDEIVTQNFENLYLALPGGFTIKGGSDLTIDTLLKSSEQVVRVAGEDATRADQGTFARTPPAGNSYDFMLRLQGDFKTAFPDGDPDENKEDETADKTPNEHLTTARSSSSVYLISDADFLVDGACFVKNEQGYTAVTNNAALLQNILDQCIGSKHLIGSRSRAATTRPFTIIKEMETNFEKDLHEELKAASKSMEGIVQQLQALQEQLSSSNAVVQSQEQESKIRELQAQQIKLRRDLREKQKGLRERKDKLYAEITWLTVATTPLFVTVTGLFVWFFRRRSTRAV